MGRLVVFVAQPAKQLGAKHVLPFKSGTVHLELANVRTPDEWTEHNRVVRCKREQASVKRPVMSVAPRWHCAVILQVNLAFCDNLSDPDQGRVFCYLIRVYYSVL